MKTRLTLFTVLITMLQLMNGCQMNQIFDPSLSELKELHKELIQSHLKKDTAFFTMNLSDRFFRVKDGEITFPDRESIHKQAKHYLEIHDFNEYTDLREPIIRISKDRSMAWSLSQVRVSGITSANGIAEPFSFTCAWITLFERRDRKWIKLGEVSSFK